MGREELGEEDEDEGGGAERKGENVGGETKGEGGSRQNKDGRRMGKEGEEGRKRKRKEWRRVERKEWEEGGEKGRGGRREGKEEGQRYLGGHDPVVGVPLWDIGLGTRWGFLVAHVDGPAVYPVFLASTLGKNEEHQPQRHPVALQTHPHMPNSGNKPSGPRHMSE